MACAASHTSFSGIGVPAFCSAFLIWPKTSPVSAVTSRTRTLDFCKKRASRALFSLSRLPPQKPAYNSPMTMADKNAVSASAQRIQYALVSS